MYAWGDVCLIKAPDANYFYYAFASLKLVVLIGTISAANKRLN